MPRTIRLAPGEKGTRLHVREIESGRGFTHLSVIRDRINSSGTVVIEGRRPCLMPWRTYTTVRNGVVIIPEGATAGVAVNGEELLPRVEHHRRGFHRGMYHKRGEPSAHHIERDGGATVVSTHDMSRTVTMWQED